MHQLGFDLPQDHLGVPWLTGPNVVPASTVRTALVYPNITYGRNLEADSFVCDLRAILPRLAIERPELEFTILLPEPVESFMDFPNVANMLSWPLPTYPNLMRTHFDAAAFLQAVDWKRRSWDVVWSHLPEQTLAIKNALYNSTDQRPPIVGYSHWVEIPELHKMAADTFPAWLAGVLSMEFCGVTTSAMKAVVIKRASQYLSAERLVDLERIIQPQMLGVDKHEYTQMTVQPGLMIWNHRPHTYTGWPTVLEALDQLWEIRQDFRVVCTLDDSAVMGKPYGAESGLPPNDDPYYRQAYFRLLGRGWLGLPRLNSHWTWPVAIADGMSVGLPYVVPVDYYIDSGDIFDCDYAFQYDDGSLTAALDWALDSPIERAAASAQSQIAAKSTSWDARIGSFIDMFDRALEGAPRVGERSTKYGELRKLAESGVVTKNELKDAMGWGIGIPWTAYRNRLIDEGIPLVP